MVVYFPMDGYYESGEIQSIVPGPDGLPDRVQVSHQSMWGAVPVTYHFSSNELFVCERKTNE